MLFKIGNVDAPAKGCPARDDVRFRLPLVCSGVVWSGASTDISLSMLELTWCETHS